jgi:hypothetical protein
MPTPSPAAKSSLFISIPYNGEASGPAAPAAGSQP